MGVADVSRRLVRIHRVIKPGWRARLFGLLLGLLIWTIIAARFPEEIMPFPDEAVLLTWEIVVSGDAWWDLAMTSWRILWGFVGSVVLGSILGIIMGTSRFGRLFVTPYILVGLSIPAIAWAAIAVLVFGIGEVTPVVATIMVTFPFIAINVWKGVENIDWDLVNMSKSFGVSRLRLLKRLILPNTAGALMTASRFGLAISWKIVTIAEMFASTNGVGYRLYQAYSGYRFERAWAWALLFMLVILIIEYGIFKPIERRVFEYRQDADFTQLG